MTNKIDEKLLDMPLAALTTSQFVGIVNTLFDREEETPEYVDKKKRNILLSAKSDSQARRIITAGKRNDIEVRKPTKFLYNYDDLKRLSKWWFEVGRFQKKVKK